jgi:hypothetical protein
MIIKTKVNYKKNNNIMINTQVVSTTAEMPAAKTK